MNFTFWVSELQEGHEVTFHFQGQRDLVRNEWQKFLNLCICQETHLDNVEEYKKVYMPLFTQSAFQSLRVGKYLAFTEYISVHGCPNV